MIPDRDQIVALVHAYAELLDAGDLDGVAGLFRDATLRSNRSAVIRRGREEALGMYRDTVLLYEDGIPCTKHVISNLVIDIDSRGATASARCYFTVLQARPELSLQPILAGRYHDHFVCREGHWRFADRLILVDLVGNLRWHVKQATG